MSTITPKTHYTQGGAHVHTGFGEEGLSLAVWDDMVQRARESSTMRHPENDGAIAVAYLRYGGSLGENGKAHGGEIIESWSQSGGFRKHLDRVFESRVAAPTPVDSPNGSFSNDEEDDEDTITLDAPATGEAIGGKSLRDLAPTYFGAQDQVAEQEAQDVEVDGVPEVGGSTESTPSTGTTEPSETPASEAPAENEQN